MNTTWTKLPAIGGSGHANERFPPDGIIAVGFGYAGLHRDGVPVYCEHRADAVMTGEAAETIAAADPDHDWRIVLDGPLWSGTFQRHGVGEWVLVERGQGFA